MSKVERMPSGTYRVRFRHGVSRKTGLPKQTSETFHRKRDAEEFAQWYAALGAQGALDRLYAEERAVGTPTLDQVAADHIEHIEGAGEAHRLKSQRLWDRTWGPRIGDVRADMIGRDALIKALGDLATNGRGPGRGYSSKSLYNQRGLLYGVLERCVAQGHLAKHPGLKLKLPQVATTSAAEDEGDPDEMVCLTPAEFERLCAAVSPHYQPMVRFMAGTGARWGEVVELRVRDLELDDPQPKVRIRRALKYSPDGKHTVGPPKTERSNRLIALPAEITADLRKLVRGRRPGDLVFTAPRGGRVQHRTFWSDQWRPAIWRAQHCPEHTEDGCLCGTAHPKRCPVHAGQGVEPPGPCYCDGTLKSTPRIHDLRHTHASWLLARGVPVHVVSMRLGHKSTQTTLDTYSHRMPDAEAAAAYAASLAFRDRPPELR